MYTGPFRTMVTNVINVTGLFKKNYIPYLLYVIGRYGNKKPANLLLLGYGAKFTENYRIRSKEAQTNHVKATDGFLEY
jgi:hypothetical protein